jgi:hypothetical protein
MLEDKFITKDDLNAALETKFAKVKMSIYRALLVQAIAVLCLFFAAYKYLH